jgi:hypothetical protein
MLGSCSASIRASSFSSNNAMYGGALAVDELGTSSSSCYPIKHQRHRPRAPLERKEEGALLHYVCNYYAHPKLAQDTQQYS